MLVHIANLDEELRERMKKPTTVIGGIAKSLKDVSEKLQEMDGRLRELEDRVKALEEAK
jgi:archaellum component FlaC